MPGYKSRKDIQRERMWRYFIDATAEIIEKEGIEQVTIRKVADKAGYTSSTVYNYFKEFSHLIFFASMRFTKDYVEELPGYIEKGNNILEKWLYMWQCFCKHSFERPEIYSIIFVNNLGTVPEELLDYYYQIYHHELVELPEEIQSIMLQHTFARRSALYLQEAVSEGLIRDEDVQYLSEVTMLTWKGMLVTYLNQRQAYTKQEAIKLALDYVYQTVMNAIPADKQKRIEIDF